MKGLIGLRLIQINILWWGWDSGQPSNRLVAWITPAFVSEELGTDAIHGKAPSRVWGFVPAAPSC